MKGAAAFIPGGCATRRISAGFQSLALYDKQSLVVWAESRNTRDGRAEAVHFPDIRGPLGSAAG